MGSAAVLAVYSAGYLRTRDAAAAIEREAASRPSRAARASEETRIAPDSVIVVDAPVVKDNTPAAGSDSMIVAPPTVAAAPLPNPPVAAKANAHPDSAAPQGATVHATGSNAATQPRPAQGSAKATVTASDSAHAPDSASVVATAGAKAAAGVAVKGSVAKDSSAAKAAPESAVVATKSDSTPTAVNAAAGDSSKAPLPPLRDGTFTGYGTSRHGDIEATIEIKDGRITSATISQCLTRYSCSWIAMLPAQVVARQTADVDVVSGATQSSDAFYFAVLAALKISRGK